MTEPDSTRAAPDRSLRQAADSSTSPSKRRILYIITRANVGGAQKHLSWLLEAFQSRFDICVIVGEKGFLTDHIEALGVTYEHLPSLRRRISPLQDVKTLFALRRAIRRNESDIVHLHSFKAALLGRIAALGLPARVVVTAHGWSFTDENPGMRKLLGKWIEKRLGRHTNRLIVVCRRDLDIALHHHIIDPEKLALIHNGVPDAVYTDGLSRRADDAIRLVCVGRLCSQKNQIALVELFRQLPQHTTLLLIGDGPHRATLERLMERHGLKERITLDTDNLDPGRRLRHCDIYVSCSRWEGLPLSVIEALRGALPVVATDVGGVNELVRDGVNGYIHSPNDTQGIVSSIVKLADNASLRNSMGTESRRLFATTYQARRFTEKTGMLYDELMFQVRANHSNR